jgi:hypothetical protein
MRTFLPIPNSAEPKYVLEVLDTPRIWVVCFRGRPINLRETHHQGLKYRRTCFLHPGFAHHLVIKLNEMFGTNEFSVTG